MAKTFRIQHNVIESNQYGKISPSAKALYTTLCYLSDKYGNKTEDNWFDRSISQLHQDTRLSRKTITRARKELVTALMIQAIIEPDYTAHIPIRYRIITWNRPPNKYKNYGKISPSNYGKKHQGSKTTTKPLQVSVSGKQYIKDIKWFVSLSSKPTS